MLRQVLLALLSVAVALAGDVKTLTDANFESSIADLDVALVKFYAPWCGHCKRLAPEFEKAATKLSKDDNPVHLIDVDCTVETAICQKHGVSGYPTLKIFRSGDLAEDYNGPRETDGIVKYMRSKAGPSSTEIKSVAEMEKFTKNSEHSIVGFFADESSAGFTDFKKLGDALSEDFRFAYTLASDVAAKFDISDTLAIFRPKRLHNKFEEGVVKYDGALELPKLKTWVNDNIHGMVGHKTTGNSNQFQRPLVVAYYAVDYELNPKGTNYWRNRVLKVAKKFSDKKVFFAVADIAESQQEFTEFGIETKSDKPIITAKDASDMKYIMSGDFSMDNLDKFVDDFLNDKIEPYLKSEPIPEDNDEFVKTVVAKNFNAIVNDASKDVLLEFYAPWCGHCKSLAPKYEELAEKLKDEAGITIAKIDATANDVPKHFQVSGFPTLYFVPADDKLSPRKYEGAREVKDFIKYLAKESTKPLSGFDKSGKEKKSEL